MRSDDVDTLQLLVDAATSWRQQALAQNVAIDIMVTRINGQVVMLRWDFERSLWDVRTAESTFTMRLVPHTDDPTKSDWVVVAQ